MEAAGKKGEWHRFRKAAITERAKAGAPLRELHKFSRHSRVDTTENCYDFATTTQLRQTAELLPRLNGFLGSGQTVERAGGKPPRAGGNSRAGAESSPMGLTGTGEIAEDDPAEIASTPMTQAPHIERFGPTRTGGGHAARSQQSASTRRVRVGPKGSKAAGGVSENGAVGSCPPASGSDPARLVIRILDLAERCLALVERGSLPLPAAPGGSVGYGDLLRG